MKPTPTHTHDDTRRALHLVTAAGQHAAHLLAADDRHRALRHEAAVRSALAAGGALPPGPVRRRLGHLVVRLGLWIAGGSPLTVRGAAAVPSPRPRGPRAILRPERPQPDRQERDPAWPSRPVPIRSASPPSR
jgi:hypothetical protein